MRALFVPFAPSLAHVSRCLAVAEAWRGRGHTAVFAVGGERIAMVNNAGFDAWPVPEVPGAVFRTDRGLKWFSSTYFSENLEAERTIMTEVDPDVAVYDFRFTTPVAARLTARPSISILHGNALRLALNPRETAQLLFGYKPVHNRIGNLRLRTMHLVFPVVFQLIMRMVVRRFASVLKEHGYPHVHSPFELLLGDERLAADLPDFLPPVLPPRTHVIGPLVWSGWEQPAPWLDEFDDRPLIYVTMGSTVEAQTILIKIISALSDGMYNVVVSTANLTLPSDLALSTNIRVFATVPGATVARRSVAVIHLGGHETLIQALAAGVPSLMLPVNPDQILVAHQAQALRMGHSLWRSGGLPVEDRWLRTITPAEIRCAIDDLIVDHGCVETCLTFKRILESYHGAALAAETLEGIVQARQGRKNPCES